MLNVPVASVEVIRYTLEQEHKRLHSNMRHLVQDGQREGLELMLCLVDAHGNAHTVSWGTHSRPRNPRDSVHAIARRVNAVAGLTVCEFQPDRAQLGTYAACLSWSLPRDLTADSCFYVLDDGELFEMPEGAYNCGPSVHVWLDETLGGVLTP